MMISKGKTDEGKIYVKGTPLGNINKHREYGETYGARTADHEVLKARNTPSAEHPEHVDWSMRRIKVLQSGSLYYWNLPRFPEKLHEF